MASLQEQLLKSGLTSSAKVKEAKAQKRKQAKQQRKGQAEITNEARDMAERARIEKAEKDRLLNQQRQEAIEEKQKVSQIMELIEANKLPQDYEKGIKYNFTDKNTVKSIYVSDEYRNQLINGKLVIVRGQQNYEMVPAIIAQKIGARDPSFIVLFNQKIEEKKESDPYAEFQVPDDLIW